MRNNPHTQYKALTVVALVAFSLPARADETDPIEQIKKLQQMVEQLQQQRADQDKQMELLNK